MLEIGSLVDGKYKILNEVGHGGMSIVYLAMNEKANKQWAIKEVRKDGVKDFEVVKQSLVAETDMLKKLNHPYLPDIVDVIEDDDRFLIVMDYIQGNSLSKAIEEYGALPQDDVIHWAKQLCDVLGYLHSQNPPIIYRDMKPANIMLKPDGNITLIDFGTAREFKEKNLADTTCLGTMGYAAPEQFGGMGQTDGRTDIYCLGATLYHLVTGKTPCEPPYEIRPIREINPSLSGGLERIILKCTQPNPANRYQNAAELMYALEHYDEIDDIYRKKQKRKLAAFITTSVITVILGATLAVKGADNNSVKYASSDQKTAAVDETTGEVTIKKAGKVSFTATLSVGDSYKTITQSDVAIAKLDQTLSFTSQNVTLVPTDDGGKLGHVKITILDKDGKEQKVISDMSGDELTKYLNGNDGKIKFKVPEGVNQQVAILCADCSIGTDGGTNTTDFIYKGITVSSNAFILFFENKPLFYGVLGVVAAAIIVPTGFVIYKKKRKTKKEASEQ